MITPLGTDTLELWLGWSGTGTMSPGSAALTSVGFAALPWQSVGDPITSADIGNPISVIGAGPNMPFTPAFGPAGEMLVSFITAVASGASCTLNNAASNTPQPGAASVVLYREFSFKSGSLRVDWALSSRARSTAEFTIESTDGSMKVATGMPVLIRDSNTGDMWGGSVHSVKITNETARNGDVLHFECACVSWASMLDRRMIDPYVLNGGVFTAVRLAEVAKHLVYDYCDSEGLRVNSVAGPIIDLNVSGFAERTVAQALDLACQTASDATHAYVWYVDAWRVVQVVEALTTAAPWHMSDLDATDKNALVKLAYTTTRDKLVNTTFLDASAVLGVAVTENYVGDGSRNTFSTTKPIGAVPTIVVGGAGQTVGPKNGSVTFQWYWAPGSGEVEVGTGGIPGAGVTVIITYQPQSRELFEDRDTTSIDTQAAIESGTGQWETKVSYSVPFAETDGPAIAQQINSQNSGVPRSFEFETYKYGLAFGQIFTVTLAKLHLTAYGFLIDSVTFTTDGNVQKWTIHCVQGPVIGDYVTALSNLGGSGGGSSGVVGVGGGSTGTGGGIATLVTDLLLTAAHTINNPGAPTASGQLWIVIARQNGTGGWAVTWGTDIVSAPDIDASSAANTMCIITFVGVGTKWYVCGLPILGVLNV